MKRIFTTLSKIPIPIAIGAIGRLKYLLELL
jgi:hypothetical protein